MFDVSFSELLVIAVVALLVIGPEKLPKVARTMGALVGRMQRYVAQVKDEINREVRFEELQKLQQEIQHNVESKLVKPVEQEAAALQTNVHAASGAAKKKTSKTSAKKPSESTKKLTEKKPAAKKPAAKQTARKPALSTK